MLAVPLSAGDWTGVDGCQRGIRNAGRRRHRAEDTGCVHSRGPRCPGGGCRPLPLPLEPLSWGGGLLCGFSGLTKSGETESSFQGDESTGFQRSRKVSSAQQHHPLLLFT